MEERLAAAGEGVAFWTCLLRDIAGFRGFSEGREAREAGRLLLNEEVFLRVWSIRLVTEGELERGAKRVTEKR